MWSATPFGGHERLVSDDSALGHSRLGVAAAAVQLILVVMTGDGPQTETGGQRCQALEVVADPEPSAPCP